MAHLQASPTDARRVRCRNTAPDLLVIDVQRAFEGRR
jgi:hypothetical protein